MVTAGLATIKSREENVRRVIDDIMPQVDVLHIHFDKGYEDIPAWYYEIDGETTQSFGTGRYGDAGKFFGQGLMTGVYITIDDDLFYPDDFVERTVEAIKKHRSPVAWGGKVLKEPPFKSYYKDSWREAYRITTGYDHNQWIDIPLTCGFGYDMDQIRFSPADFHAKNMADIWAGVKCRNEGLDIMAIAHEGIGHQEIDFDDTIFSVTSQDDGYVTEMLNKNWK